MENPGLVVRGQAAPFSTALRSLINNPRYRCWRCSQQLWSTGWRNSESYAWSLW
ncbi:rCG50263 [Rattus norvegicus]|uniref:RCG50263 n=1 Tax=Rattus norvegicus TaxID=10116 RepID=A6JZC1_RAT|nr:rCG50263 [Rattus norvegicus]